MCGIFGVTVSGQSQFTSKTFRSAINDLFVLSESRGKEASGLAISTQDTILVYKDSVSASSLIHGSAYNELLEETCENGMLSRRLALGQPITVIGHSRLVTNGSMEVHENNQPVISSGIVGIHNGIIVNDAELWREFPAMERHHQVDTEVVLGLIRNFYTETGSMVEAIRSAFQLIEGTASVAVLFEDIDALALATNNGSLYTCSSESKFHIFASERYILRMLTKRGYLRKLIGDTEIQPVAPGFGLIIDTLSANTKAFSLAKSARPHHVTASNGCFRSIVDVTPRSNLSLRPVPPVAVPTVVPDSIFRRFSVDTKPIMLLRRCTKCLLPETMPFIDYDERGMCNYCRNYKRIEVLGEDALLAAVDRYRSRDGSPDCIVTFSGGRDSSFGVHYVKNVLKMNPITYTYDWGMVTDLARRNQARLCGKLGVEHILVSADIRRKREYIRKNVTAWLKRPDLGTVPLFMAGDKQYFYYANKLRQQTGVKFIFLCENLLETTKFKSGYCGVRPSFGEANTYTLSVFNKAKLATYYGKQYVLNPAYVNASLLDTLWAFASYYMIPHNYLNLYQYIMWDEKEITSTLIREYDWEVAEDTQTTWRIGDGTAAFYNYIYYCIAGFTENDTFRSNQIREGAMTREQALAVINDENQPRFESIQWYCNTIGIDMESTLERINSAPRLYGSR